MSRRTAAAGPVARRYAAVCAPHHRLYGDDAHGDPHAQCSGSYAVRGAIASVCRFWSVTEAVESLLSAPLAAALCSESLRCWLCCRSYRCSIRSPAFSVYYFLFCLTRRERSNTRRGEDSRVTGEQQQQRRLQPRSPPQTPNEHQQRRSSPAHPAGRQRHEWSS